MSVSKVDICNFALQAIGDEAILSLTDGTTQAQQCNLRYDSARRAVLEMGLWNFAIKRVSLPQNATAPVFDFSFAFTLPADNIRVIGTERELGVNFGTDPLFNGYKTIGFGDAYTGRDRYRIESGNLLYDDDVCKIAYVSNIEDTTKFSPLFVESFAIFLASRIAYKITGSRAMEQELLDEFYKVLKKEAHLSDSQQDITTRQTKSRFASVRF